METKNRTFCRYFKWKWREALADSTIQIPKLINKIYVDCSLTVRICRKKSTYYNLQTSNDWGDKENDPG